MGEDRSSKTTKEKSVETTKTKNYPKCILGNKSYGLYYGEVESYDPVTEVAIVRNCRHVCRWFGKTGGITSLAAYGLCGPRASESRIGAPNPRSTMAGIVACHECTPEAAATLDQAVVS